MRRRALGGSSPTNLYSQGDFKSRSLALTLRQRFSRIVVQVGKACSVLRSSIGPACHDRQQRLANDCEDHVRDAHRLAVPQVLPDGRAPGTAQHRSRELTGGESAA